MAAGIVSVGWSRTDVHLLDRESDHWTTVIAGVDANTSLGFAADDRSLVGISTLDAPRGRVVRIPLDAEQIAGRPVHLADPGRRAATSFSHSWASPVPAWCW